MKTYVYVGTSLDGFIAKRDGSLDWLTPFQNREVAARYEKFISTIDAHVIGRGTYETVLSFPAWGYTRPVIVLSTTLKTVTDTLKKRVTVLDATPKEALTYLAGRGFSNVYVDGGKVIQSFLKDDLIDEMIVTRVPVLLGDGIPLFGTSGKERLFEHKETTVLTNGLVTSRYHRKRT